MTGTHDVPLTLECLGSSCDGLDAGPVKQAKRSRGTGGQVVCDGSIRSSIRVSSLTVMSLQRKCSESYPVTCLGAGILVQPGIFGTITKDIKLTDLLLTYGMCVVFQRSQSAAENQIRGK